MSRVNSNEILKHTISSSLIGRTVRGISFHPVCYNECPPFCDKDEIYFQDIPQPFLLYIDDYEVFIDLKETEYDSELVVEIAKTSELKDKNIPESEFWQKIIGHKIVNIAFLFEKMVNKVISIAELINQNDINCFSGIAFVFDNKLSFAIYSADVLEFDNDTYTFGRPASSKILLYKRDPEKIYANLPVFYSF